MKYELKMLQSSLNLPASVKLLLNLELSSIRCTMLHLFFFFQFTGQQLRNKIIAMQQLLHIVAKKSDELGKMNWEIFILF